MNIKMADSETASDPLGAEDPTTLMIFDRSNVITGPAAKPYFASQHGASAMGRTRDEAIAELKVKLKRWGLPHD